MTTIEAIRGQVVLQNLWTPVLQAVATDTRQVSTQIRKTLGDMGNQIAADFKGVGSKIRASLTTDLQATAKGLDSFGAKAKGVAGSLLPVSLAVAGVGIASVKMATDLNASMANVATLIPNNTRRILELKNEVQGMAQEFGKGTTDISGGLYELISSIGDTADVTKILETNVKAGAAGMATTADAINLTTAVTKTYGDTSAEAFQKVADLAFRATDIGKTTFPELARAIGGVAPIAREVGVSMEEMFAVIATATGVTGNTSEVTTQMASAITALISPSKEMATLYEQLGIKSGQALIEQQGLVGALQTVAKGAKDTGVQIIDLVGRKEAYILTASLANSQAAKFTDTMGKMQNVSGSLDRSFNEQTKGINAAGFQWSQFQVKMEVTAQRLGDALIPSLVGAGTALAPMIDKLILGVEWFGKAPQPIQATVIGLGGLLGIGAPLAFAIGGISQGLAVLIPLMKGVTLAGSLIAAKFVLVTAGVIAFLLAVKESTVALYNFFGAVGKGEGMKFLTARDEDNWVRRMIGWGKAAEEVKAPVAAAANTAGDLAKQIEASMKAAQEQAAALFKSGNAAGANARNQDKLTAALKKQADERARVKAELREFNNWRGEREIEAYGAAQEALKAKAAEQRAYQNMVGERIIENAQLELEAIAKIKAAQAEKAAEYRQYLNWVGERRMEADAAAMAKADWRGGASANLSGVMSGLPQLLVQAFTGGGGIGGAMKAVGIQMAEAITKPMMNSLTTYQQRSVQAGSIAATAIGGMAGGQNGALIAGVASSLGGAAVAATGWGTSMAAAGMAGSLALGAATMGIGLAAVGIYMLYKKWRGVSEEVKEARKEVAEFQKEIRGTMTAQQQAEAGGQDWAATTITVRDAMRGLGMEAGEADRKAQELSKALWDDKNPERVKAAMQAISDIVGAWQGKLKVANEEISGLVNQAEELGIKLPASIIESITEMARLGLLTEDNIALIREMSGNADVDFKKMEEAANKYKIPLESLGQSYQGLKGADAAQNIINDFDLLTRGGASVGTVLHGMREEISGLVADSVKFGTSIPENMKPWIEELLRTGQLTDANGVALKDLAGIQFGDPILTAFERITNKLQEVIDAIIGSNGLGAALKSLPKNTTLEVDLIYREDGSSRGRLPANEDPGYAAGTIGRHGRWFKNFGAGTRTTLHNDEAVVRSDQAGAFAADMMNSTAGAGAGGSTPIYLVARDGGRILADVMVENLGSSLKRIGIGT